MPTIALLNGHTFAGGLMTAFHHDYRVQNPTRGFLCLNELDFGVPLQPPMSSIFRQKLPPAAYRSLVLEARRFPGPHALEAGIVDALGGLDEALALIKERGLATKAKTGVYGAMKAEMYRESLGYLAGREEDERRMGVYMEAEEERRSKGAEWVAGFKSEGKAKL